MAKSKLDSIPIKNYSSEMPARDSQMKISQLLLNAGAETFGFVSGNIGEHLGIITGVEFVFSIHLKPVRFRIDAKADQVFRVMIRKYENPAKYQIDKVFRQAQRTAWKNLLETIHLHINQMQLEQAGPLELFLPHAVAATGKTLYQSFADENKTDLLQ